MDNQITEEFMKETRNNIVDIKVSVGKIETNVEHLVACSKKHENRVCALEKDKVDKENFYFWRNLLVGGILLSVSIAIFALIIDKFFN